MNATGLLLGIAALLCTGCDEGITAGVMVDNRTSQELHFQVELEDRLYRPVAQAHPHSTALVLPAAIMPSSRCTSGPSVALDAAEREVARHEAPLCMGDDWVIE
jgi:hypothetical protein